MRVCVLLRVHPLLPWCVKWQQSSLEQRDNSQRQGAASCGGGVKMVLSCWRHARGLLRNPSPLGTNICQAGPLQTPTARSTPGQTVITATWANLVSVWFNGWSTVHMSCTCHADCLKHHLLNMHTLMPSVMNVKLKQTTTQRLATIRKSYFP